jgi:creatinine amidohydrolase
MRPSLITGSLIAVVLAGPAAAQQPRSTGSRSAAELPSVILPPELDRVLRDYERAWRAGDAPGLAALFAEDGFVLQGGRPPVRGRAAIRAAYTGSGGGPLRLRALGFATADTVASIVGAYGYDPEPGDQGKFTLTLRRPRGGRWLIFSDMDNSSRQSPPTSGLNAASRSVRIETLSWTEAERVLDTSTVVMIPLGAESKEHGPHLPLNNDFLLAEYFTRRVMDATRVVVYPTINYNFYPAFLEYPGSTSLGLGTARDLVVDIVRSIARHGPRRFYILNTGVSTLRALAPARDSLAASGIVMAYTDILNVGREAEDRVRQQAGGTHADEIETSIMLYMHPEVVHMDRAPDDYHPGAGGLTRDSASAVREGKTWSRTGTFGNATLATREKGRVLVEAQVAGMVAEIERLRRLPIP